MKRFACKVEHKKYEFIGTYTSHYLLGHYYRTSTSTMGMAISDELKHI